MFNNPLRKYQVGGSVATPSEEQQEMLAAFVEWLPTKVKEFANMQPEQIVDALNEISKTPDGQKQIQSLMEQFKKEISELSSSKFKKGGKLHDFICKHGKGAKMADCGCMDDGGEIKSLQKTPNNRLVKLTNLANINYRPNVSEKPTQKPKIVEIENLRQAPSMILIDPRNRPVQTEESMRRQWQQMERTPSKLLNPIQNLINRQYEEGGEIANARDGYKVKNGSYEASVTAPGDTTRIKNYKYRTDTMQTYPDGTVRYHTTDNNGANNYRWDLSKGRPNFWRRLLYGSKPATEFDKENWENIIANHPEDPRNILRNEEGGVIKAQRGLSKIAKTMVNTAKSARKTGTYVPEQAIGKPFFGNAVRFSKSISPERYRAVINWRLANDPNYKLSLDSMERAMESMGNIDIAYDLYRLKNFGATNKAEFLQFEDMMNRGLTGNQVINSLKVRPGNNGIFPLDLGPGHYAKEAEQMVFHPYVSGIGNFKQGGVIKGQEGTPDGIPETSQVGIVYGKRYNPIGENQSAYNSDEYVTTKKEPLLGKQYVGWRREVKPGTTELAYSDMFGGMPEGMIHRFTRVNNGNNILDVIKPYGDTYNEANEVNTVQRLINGQDTTYFPDRAKFIELLRSKGTFANGRPNWIVLDTERNKVNNK